MAAPNPSVQDALVSLAGSTSIVVPASERVADRIRAEVAEARLRVGARLPEQALGEALAVSRNTLREALSQLVAERVLVRVPNRGVFVARPEIDDVRDVYAARLVIEPGAVRYGALAADPAALAAVRAAYEEGRAAAGTGDWTGVAAANQHFHREIVALAGSPRLEREMGRLLAEMRLVFQRMLQVREFHEPYLARNGEIAELLGAGRTERAADELARYLATARDQLLDAYALL
ncbi:GntR family transcriptional regulator [Pseudonocardia sp. HH130630-07]|uniref:GntR family transcriptional regulator n=1 Tax=Pseudonocardia sp. HH130630-07 TaxID=1690815 RepID=UPI000814CCFC|nr:GntR family transcriptional regulator [Pseudonocardia sp. HH130630-07]ANY07022.1 GntR family transcriptional regulator [Pseudonocardia sp. HH130630-07]